MRSAISRLSIPAACLGLLLGAFQTPAHAEPLTPFPPGGMYAGETMRFFIDAFTELQLQNPVLGYGGVSGTPGSGPGDVDYSLSMFLSATMCLSTCGPSSASGPAMVRALAQPDGSFDTEMLSMDLVGGPNPFGPGPVMIRESPTLPSLGMTSLGSGPMPIDSFFDIFTELSFDGGQTWMQDQNGSSTFTLQEPVPEVPEPATLLLVGTGFAVMARSVRRRNRKA